MGHEGQAGTEGHVSIEVLVALLAKRTMVEDASSTYGVAPRQVVIILSSTDVTVIVCVLLETTDIICPAPPAWGERLLFEVPRFKVQVEAKLLLIGDGEWLVGCPERLTKTVDTEVGAWTIEENAEDEVVVGFVELDPPAKGAAVGTELHGTDIEITELPTNANREHPILTV